MAKAEQIPDDLARVRRLLARERAVDRGAWLRLSGWGVAAIAAVTIGAYAYDVSGGFRRDNATSADLIRDLRSSQQVLQQQMLAAAKDAQTETKRLSATIATLNSDRDRLYTRVSTLEQSLDSVTGSLSRQAAALATATTVPPVTQPPPPASVSPSIAPEPFGLQSKGPETAVAAATPPSETSASRTVFGIDLGAAPSLDGLRAVWRREAAASSVIAGLQPIVVIRDGGSPAGMALHLVAGPIGDAAAAARLCASLSPREKACEPAAYDGQRLALDIVNAAPAPTAPRKKPKLVRPQQPAVPLPTAPPPSSRS